jgi:SagB-type dehydrogenase family enzyme
MSVEEAIAARRSVRAFADKRLDSSQIAQLAWAAQGATEPMTGYRAAPSAGALYPLEVYLLSSDGTYRYVPEKHGMEILDERDLRSELARAALHQHFIAQAPLDVVIGAVYERVTRKYGRRGARYVDIEVGHAAQNVMLQAVAMGLGTVAVGAFDDGAVKDALGLPPDVEPLYIIPVGYGR